MGEPTVMIGVGAAKCGTSWLYRYLADHPECHFKSLKELHYFNGFDINGLDWNLARVRGIQGRLQRDAAGDISDVQLANKLVQLAQVEHYLEVLETGHEDTQAYLAYLTEGGEGAKLVGEITPAYSLLGADRLRRMAAMAGDVRFVYLMRDPVERLWSHVRMTAQHRCKKPQEFRDRAANVLRRVFAGDEDHIAKRSDYEGTLKKLAAAVDPSRLCVAIYEDLFAGDALQRICRFLGISFVRPDPGSVIHASRALEMDEDQRKASALWLAPQYDAVARTLGKLPEAWAGNLVRV